ncbi:MAG: hypothetical protein AAGA67_13660 [Cyanobacteria bacterium P01_F01_bin.153]
MLVQFRCFSGSAMFTLDDLQKAYMVAWFERHNWIWHWHEKSRLCAAQIQARVPSGACNPWAKLVLTFPMARPVVTARFDQDRFRDEVICPWVTAVLPAS